MSSGYSTSNVASITNAINTCADGIYTSTNTIYYDASAGTITSTCYPFTIEETYPNELKINIKKFQIKFNFNL